MAKFSRFYELLKLNIGSYSHFAVEIFLLVILVFTVGINFFMKTSLNRAERQNDSLFFSYLKNQAPGRNEKLLQAYGSVNIKLAEGSPKLGKYVLSASTISSQSPNDPKKAPLPTLSGSALQKPNPSTNSPVVTFRDVEVYEVKNGDTVGEIADAYGVSVNTILWENNLASSGTIKPGQQLNILPVSGVKHTVQKGETISSIAKKYGITDENGIEEIFEMNSIEAEDLIQEGEELIIPNGVKKAPPTPQRQQYLVDVRKEDYQKHSVPENYAGSGTGLIWPIPCAHRLSQSASRRHMAIDVPAKYCPVVASADGIIEQAGWKKGYGYMVMVNHGNGLSTLYAHGSQILVAAGEKVAQGQGVMISGNTGRSTGPHLHFEVRVGGSLKNPLSYVKP